jgi:hypothetical protein
VPAARIDLHTHSTASDGTTPPEQLVRLAAAAGLDVVALTDHDTTTGHRAAAAALPAGLTLVPGAEISCERRGVSLHLLAYLFDPEEPALATALQALRESRTGRAERMVRRLEQAGTGVTWARVRQLAQGTVGRPHVARALVEQGHVATVSDAFSADWIGTHGRFWEPKVELDVLDAVRLVARAGGVTVFAHPAADSRGRIVGDDVVEEMAEAGLVGLEVDHVDHVDDAKRRLRRLADGLDLVVTGSSDFHGDNKTVRLGERTTSARDYERLVEKATGAAPVTA